MIIFVHPSYQNPKVDCDVFHWLDLFEKQENDLTSQQESDCSAPIKYN